MDGCPEKQDSYTSCQTPAREIVYQGTDLSVFEDDLPPFTGNSLKDITTVRDKYH